MMMEEEERKKRGDGGREKKEGSKKFRPGTEVLICASEAATTFFLLGSGVQRFYPSIRGKKKLPPAELSRPLPFPARERALEKIFLKNSGLERPMPTPHDSGLSSLSAIR